MTEKDKNIMPLSDDTFSPDSPKEPAAAPPVIRNRAKNVRLKWLVLVGVLVLLLIVGHEVLQQENTKTNTVDNTNMRESATRNIAPASELSFVDFDKKSPDVKAEEDEIMLPAEGSHDQSGVGGVGSSGSGGAKPKIEKRIKPLSQEYVHAQNLKNSALIAPTKIDFSGHMAEATGDETTVQAQQPSAGFGDVVDTLTGGGSLRETIGAALANATAKDDQDRKKAFLKGGANEVPDEYIKNELRAQGNPYEIKAGTIISGVMMSGINSNLPGLILGQVSENIYDTATGKHLLIPQGSRIVGAYDSHVIYGQTRILAVWNRIIYPDGSSLNIEGMGGTDSAGYAGFKQKVDNHYSRLIGAALFSSVFAAAGKIATENDKDKDGKETLAAEAVMEQMTSLGARIAERNLNLAPTLRILPGYRFSAYSVLREPPARTFRAIGALLESHPARCLRATPQTWRGGLVLLS